MLPVRNARPAAQASCRDRVGRSPQDRRLGESPEPRDADHDLARRDGRRIRPEQSVGIGDDEIRPEGGGDLGGEGPPTTPG